MNSKLHWYWRRLRAMTPSEVRRHCLKRFRQLADARKVPEWPALSFEPVNPAGFPRVPSRAAAPAVLREALRRDAGAILAGRWRAFGDLEIQVDDPPRWHTDYLAGVDLASDASAFGLNHRQQPGGADIKLIWEPNRWCQLARLAQAAWLLNDARAADTCQRWLADWTRRNPPYRGLNWTSALETGIRLVQFAWIDALLGAANLAGAEWPRLRGQMLPAHVWYTWRHQSFGSSANNHLLGELAGLIAAVARWPALAGLAAPLAGLQAAWEAEVLRQFAPDGGNREEALGYHLFSWELCWQARAALLASGRTVSPPVTERLSRAASFYAELKMDEWDYGDSDNAFVTPFFADETNAAGEWRAWFDQAESSPAIQFWWSDAAVDRAVPDRVSSGDGATFCEGWRMFADSGYATFRSADWTLRWDLSRLGYLSTAAHGHLDALQLSVAHRGVSFVIDPGTGAYYAEPALREYLASWRAHNGPHRVGVEVPERLGTFLWGKAHEPPAWKVETAGALRGEVNVAGVRMQRVVRYLASERGWEITDGFRATAAGGAAEFAVHWQFAPGTRLDQVEDRTFRAVRHGVGLSIEFTPGWSAIQADIPGERERNLRAHRLADLDPAPIHTVCSPAFRQLQVGPSLWLTGRGGLTGDCRSRFLPEASPA